MNEKETSRFEAFSDGIFAGAITLLSIDIGIKSFENSLHISVWKKGEEEFPEILAPHQSLLRLF